MYPPHLHPRVCAVYWISSCIADSSHFGCLMRFVFLGAELCRQLPSDSTSRWTPLLLASGWRLQTPTVDFHHLGSCHARHTKKGKPDRFAFHSGKRNFPDPICYSTLYPSSLNNPKQNGYDCND